MYHLLELPEQSTTHFVAPTTEMCYLTVLKTRVRNCSASRAGSSWGQRDVLWQSTPLAPGSLPAIFGFP